MGNEAAELYWAVLDAGVVRRLDLLNEALERARRDGAAEALEQAAGAFTRLEWLTPAEQEALASWLQDRARLHQAGEQ